MAIPHEKGTRETKQRPNAWDGVFSEVQGSSSLGHIPDPAPEVRTETQKQEQAPKPEDANPSEETQLLALQPSGSQGRVTFGDDLLTQHSSIPGWACLRHTPALRGVTGGETAQKHPGIYGKTHSG